MRICGPGYPCHTTCKRNECCMYAKTYSMWPADISKRFKALKDLPTIDFVKAEEGEG